MTRALEPQVAVKGDATNDDRPDFNSSGPQALGVPPEELELLRSAMRRAFALARRGDSATGVQFLQASAEQAAHRARQQRWAPALRRQWQLSLDAYGRLTELASFAEETDLSPGASRRERSEGDSSAPPR